MNDFDPEERTRQRQRVETAFRSVFCGSPGQTVLDELARRSRIYACSFRDGGNALSLAFWEGRRSLLHDIHHLISRHTPNPETMEEKA